MTDPQRPQWPDPTQPYPQNTDPAYSGYWSQPTQYGSGYGGPMTQPTEQIPPYWHGSGYPGAAPPPPPPPKKTPRWLWAAAGAAVLVVTGLVLALVIISSSTRDTTVVAPPSTSTAPPPAPSASSRPPAPLPLPPTETLGPSETAVPPTEAPPTEPVPSGTETVVYRVSGEGRAINITYVDNGRVMQTEFNVALPWSKQVSLSAPAKTTASVAVVNVGRDVSCSITVNGAQVQQRTGRGLTICTGAA